MKLIIAGSRTIKPSLGLIENLLNTFKLYPNEIVSGTAGGVDRAGENYVKEYNTNCWHLDLNGEVTLKTFSADWDTHGKAAGPIRNKQMAEYADALLLIWDGESRGSANMKREMQKLGKPIYEVILRSNK